MTNMSSSRNDADKERLDDTMRQRILSSDVEKGITKGSATKYATVDLDARVDNQRSLYRWGWKWFAGVAMCCIVITALYGHFQGMNVAWDANENVVTSLPEEHTMAAASLEVDMKDELRKNFSGTRKATARATRNVKNRLAHAIEHGRQHGAGAGFKALRDKSKNAAKEEGEESLGTAFKKLGGASWRRAESTFKAAAKAAKGGDDEAGGAAEGAEGGEAEEGAAE